MPKRCVCYLGQNKIGRHVQFQDQTGSQVCCPPDSLPNLDTEPSSLLSLLRLSSHPIHSQNTLWPLLGAFFARLPRNALYHLDILVHSSSNILMRSIFLYITVHNLYCTVCTRTLRPLSPHFFSVNCGSLLVSLLADLYFGISHTLLDCLCSAA